MLANNNEQIIRKLAKNTVRTNRRQYGILFVTVALSAFLIFTVFTIGITYLDLSRMQDARLYGAECDVAVMNGFTEAQKETVEKNPGIQTVGTQAYAGHVISTEKDDTAHAGMLWGDEEFWEKQKAPVVTAMEGKYPKAENELLATRKALAACGIENLEVGDHFLMTYEDNTGIHTKEFTISGIWSGYGTDQENFYVSGAFYEQSGYQPEKNGILLARFKSRYVTTKTLETLRERLNLSRQQVFQASDYIERSITILLAICGLCMMICLSAYLLIYNILYLSVSGKIRYYGLLKTLGMTKKQLVRFIRKQLTATGTAGMLIGIISGMILSLLLIPYAMKILGISLGNAEMHFQPVIVVISVLLTGIAIVLGIRTPIRMAADITPAEAVRYRVTHEKVCGSSKEKKGNLYWRMAKEQIVKDRKKTAIVVLSLSVSLIVFYCLTTIIDSQGTRTVYPNYFDADFIIQNSTQTTEEISSLQAALSDEMIAELKKTEGVAEMHVVKGISVVFPYEENDFADFWIRGYTEIKPYLSYAETVSDYQKNPEKYYGMIKGIDEKEFDHLNECLGNTVNKQEFLKGNVAILQYAGFEIPDAWLGRSVSFMAGSQTQENQTQENQTQESQAQEDRMQEIAIGAVSYESYYGASVNFGANLIVSEEYLKTLTRKPYNLSLTLKYGQSYDEETENAVKEQMEISPYRKDLFYLSKYEDMKTIQDSQSGMFEIGTVISLLLLFVGMLNYINTMSGSMQNRKLTFSIMESVGMSGRQVMKLLVREGILYAAGSVLLTVTVGTAVTYGAFQAMNYMKIPFTVPVFPLLCAVALVMVICAVTPVAVYKKIVGNRSVVERIREYEE